ncbi:MAG: hypothetical protein ACI38Q_02375 [Candidatus Bruticola sp.]
MEKYTPEEILNKLTKTFNNEGVRFTDFNFDKELNRLNVSLERFAPGLPTAFLVKGLQGTLRRYLNPQAEVVLSSYRVLSETAQNQSQSSELLKSDLFKASSHSEASVFKGTPCLDLRGASARDAASGLENFIRIVERQNLTCCFLYLDDKHSRRVAKQWAAINGAKLKQTSSTEQLWQLILPTENGAANDEYKLSELLSNMEVLPYNILLLRSAE